ncbi:Rrf2 family transcriptional regulator [Rhodohalobacter sp.]|uniref:RrF2 family transcriptional regulator n=1 Tax=Rhodohalobacter sp. TaxID=1974210 RepID=UPI002ACE5752|nr:Rrf2 family transcriptional regulator [Rhodohalobacter sp.]MDZ7756965.1 Rrf2 family transcriptional regulator [Rhodohalobacter sp.]
MFSTSCHYGLQAMIYIALHSTNDKNVDLGQIAEKQDIPKHFLSKILQMLVKNGLLNSMKGPTGGFSLSRPADDITLIEVIDAIDGLDVFTQCGIGFKRCDDDHPCPIHNEYKQVRNNIRELFENKTLLELSEDIESGDSIVSLGKPLNKD